MTARPSRLRNSVGSSWSEAEENSDADFVQYSSELESELDFGEDADKEVEQTRQDKATPIFTQKAGHTSSSIHNTPRSTPKRNISRMAKMTSSRSTQRSPHSANSTPQSEEPSFIMPSMNSPLDSYAMGSPMPKGQVRNRKQRQSAEHSLYSGSPRQPSRKASKAHTPQKQEDEVSPWHYGYIFYENFIRPLLSYFIDVIGYANRHFLKPILGLALGVGLIVLGIQMASSLLYSRLNAALAPVCLIPGSSYVFSMCATPEAGGQANFEELIKVQSRFEEVLDASKDTFTLPASIKDSELAIRDLRTLVKHSRLPSRHQLDLEFRNFVLTAKQASADLVRFNSRIGGTMGRVIATNSWTKNVLEGLEQSEANKGVVARIAGIATSAFLASSPTLEQRIFDQYILHISNNKNELTSLIKAAQALLVVLTNLDERLDTIHSITVGDDATISRNQDELLTSLWTKLGGNAVSVKANSKHLNLLRNISQYRRLALKHVSETLLKLQEIETELEELREGVTAPEVLGWRQGVPITYYIGVVDQGLERLRVVRGESERIESEVLRDRLNGIERTIPELGDGKKAPVVTVRAK